MSAPTGPWMPQNPRQFVDRRTQLRQGRLQVLHVRAYRGTIVRKPLDGEGRLPIYDTCPHAHSKASAARACGEAAARRLNRAIARGEDWAWLRAKIV